MAKTSIGRTLGFAFGFAGRNIGDILRRITLPVITGCGLLYLTADAYLAELQIFFDAPTDRHASLVLGLATAGLLAILFLHAVVSAAVCELEFGKTSRAGWPYFHITRQEWRLYAALLRFLLVVLVYIAAVEVARWLAGMLIAPDTAAWTSVILLVGGLFWLFVRLGFLITPIAVAQTRGKILRSAWRFSAGRFWPIATITVTLIVPGVLVELLGENLMHAIGVFPLFTGADSVAHIAAAFRQMLPIFVIIVSISYALVTVLLTSASFFVYRAKLQS